MASLSRLLTHRKHLYPFLVALIFVAGVWLRAAPIAQNRFHEDEALYAYWGLQISTGADPMLNGYPVDKPPLFPYLLSLLFGILGPSESVARLPSLFASSISILLIAGIGRLIYGEAVGLLGAASLAFSPFDISFAGTAFTDPLLSMWVLAALLAALSGRFWLTGCMWGLAFDTKQQAVLFIPLILGACLLAAGQGRRPATEALQPPARWERARQRLQKAWGAPGVRGAIGAILGIAPAIWWDAARTQRPGFLQQSLISYGGLSLSSWNELAERAQEWSSILGRFSGSIGLNLLLLGGLLALAVMAIGRLKQDGPAVERRSARFDLLLIGFVSLFLILHWSVRFRVWDRYVLGLVPLCALVAGRALMLPARALSRNGQRSRWRSVVSRFNAGLALALVCLTLGSPATQAAQGQYPAGGDHGVYLGVDEAATYLRDHVPPAGVIHHRWLGWHYLYYMYDDPHVFRWYRSPVELVEQVDEWPDVPHWMAFPEWQDRMEAEKALDEAGLSLEEMHIIARPDGSISFRIFRIVRNDLRTRDPVDE